MKKRLLAFFATLAFIFLFSSCEKEKISVSGNGIFELKDIQISGFGSADAIQGTLRSKVYTATDTSASYIITEGTSSFNITNPVSFNQIFNYDFNDRTKKIEFYLTIRIVGSAANLMKISNINYKHNNVVKYNQDNFVKEGTFDTYSFEPIIIEL